MLGASECDLDSSGNHFDRDEAYAGRLLGNGFKPAISGDGRWVTYSHLGGMNIVVDGRYVGGPFPNGGFVWDRDTSTAYLLTASGDQDVQYPVMPDDGHLVAYRRPGIPGELELWMSPLP